MKKYSPVPCAPILISLVCAMVFSARADTFVYDDAGRLQSASQTNGLNHSYSYDAEADLLSASHSGTDTTDTNGPGNGIPDWWENYWFGTRGIDPLASQAGDGVSNLMKFALGLNPLIRVSSYRPVSLTFQSYTDGVTYPYLTFIRSKDAGSLLYLEKSSDLVMWLSGGSYFTQIGLSQDLGDGTESVVMRSLTPQQNALSLFFRLRATKP